MQYNKHLFRHLRFAIGQNIHHMRAEKRITLQKLSRLSNIPEHLLDHYELGKSKISLEELLRIACALGVGIKTFIEAN